MPRRRLRLRHLHDTVRGAGLYRARSILVLLFFPSRHAHDFRNTSKPHAHNLLDEAHTMTIYYTLTFMLLAAEARFFRVF